MTRRAASELSVVVSCGAAGVRRWAALATAVLLGFTGLAAQAGQPLTVTGANSYGNSVYSLTLSTSTPPAPPSALITGIKTINTDGAKHGSYDALVWAPNSVTGTLDLIAADVAKHQIVRYSGPNYGTSTPVFTWTNTSGGPAHPVGLSFDPSTGNLFVISPSCSDDAKPGVWVLPFNPTTGNYGAPVIIDRTFSNVKTLALAEVIVAQSAATAPSGGKPAWNVGDLLVLVGDTFNARVIVYSKAAIAGVLANPPKPLTGPTSTAITLAQFQAQSALPQGMDIWPADATHGVSLLFTTADGRVLRFDSGHNAFAGVFANVGLNLQKIRVGSYLNVPYAFIAQLVSSNGGKILQFGAPPATGTNKPLATISQGLSAPIGLAVTVSGSAPASQCLSPTGCSPIGSTLTTNIVANASTIPPTANLLEESCVIPVDPRVTVNGTSWSCAGGTIDIFNYCPTFPHTIVPPFACGHSGPTGAGFVAVKLTAPTIDQNANTAFFQTITNADVPLPGPLNLACPKVPTITPNVPMVLWTTRSDLPNVEGTIVEDVASPYYADFTGACDGGTGTHRTASMFAYGLGLNQAPSGLGSGGLPGFVTSKFDNLTATVQAASIDGNVSTTTQAYVAQAKNYFNSEINDPNNVNGFSCALNTLASGDNYVRQNLASFHFAAPPLGNPNPAGESDARLATAYQTISSYFALQGANGTWPATNVPPCVTIAPALPSVVQGGTTALIWGAATTNPPLTTAYGPTSCSVMLSDPTAVVVQSAGSLAGSSNLQTVPLNSVGKYTALLQCTGSGGPNAVGSARTTITVTPPPPVIGTFTATPSSVVSGGTTSLSWSTSNVVTNGCSVSSAAAGISLPGQPANSAGTTVTPPTTAGSYLFTLTCNGQAGTTAASGTTTVVVTVPPPTLYVIGGTLGGLASNQSIQLQNNGGDNLTVSANGPFAFATPLPTGAAYAVTITSSPAGESCSVANGTGTVGSGAVTSVSISCVPNAIYAVSATVSGLPSGATGLTLQNNLADDLSVPANGTFAFATPLANQVPYSVTIKTQPTGAVCTVANGSGTINGASVAATVTCTPTYTIGGTLTGLPSDQSIVLQNNKGDPLTLTGNGTFQFATPLTSGALYSVTIRTAPGTGTCIVTGGDGTVASAPVTSVVVTCSASLVVLTATPQPVPLFGTPTLTWTTSGALNDPNTQCAITDTQGNTFAPQSGSSGSQQVPYPLSANDVATIVCVNTGNNVQASASLNIAVVTSYSNPTGLLYARTCPQASCAYQLFVADSDSGQVLVYTETEYGLRLDRSLTQGLSKPVALALDGSYNLYVADKANGAVVVFDPSGTFLSSTPLPANGQPSGVVLDGDNILYVADQANNALDVYLFEGGLTSPATKVASYTGSDAGTANPVTFAAPLTLTGSIS